MNNYKEGMNIELLSIDLSNYCTKECPFCYNHSDAKGNIIWKPDEIISLAKDCIQHGVKAVSLGGGEPFEYDGVFQIIDALQPMTYLSVTTNGLPLLQESVWSSLMQHRPDKIHITIHNPDSSQEVERVVRQLEVIQMTDITVGVNLLVASSKIDHCKNVYGTLRHILTPSQIILVPQRFADTPTPQQLSAVASKEPFQAPSCILGCKPPKNFCSISWDKKANRCSYAGGKHPLPTLTYQGICEAMEKVDFRSCMALSKKLHSGATARYSSVWLKWPM